MIKTMLSLFLMLSTVFVVATANAAQDQPPSGAPLNSTVSAEDMDQLLAPIALYPDALIVQVLQCSVSPYQVKQVNDWLQKNPDLRGTLAQDAASKQGFDASFVALVLFPDVIKNMAEKPDWTRELGRAFTTQRDDVFASVQRMREEAKKFGNLKSNEQQKVEQVKTDDGDTVIVIQPANPQVVYVPQYTTQVYTQPAAPPEENNDGAVLAAGLIGFAAGVIVGAAADDDNVNFYYHYGGWGYHGAVCYPGGYNNYYKHRERMAEDFYDHRERMANDWYDHREDLADRRGDNVEHRGDNVADRQENRQGSRTENRGGRQDTRTESQGQRQDARGQNQSDRRASASTREANRGGTASRGSFGNRPQNSSQATQRSRGTQSGAFSNYQRGSTERRSSQRGRSSLSGRSGGGARSGGRRR